MLDALKTGDKVVTSGGLRGTIMALKDDSVHLRVPPNNILLEVTKASVTQVTTTEEEVKTNRFGTFQQRLRIRGCWSWQATERCLG